MRVYGRVNYGGCAPERVNSRDDASQRRATPEEGAWWSAAGCDICENNVLEDCGVSEIDRFIVE